MYYSFSDLFHLIPYIDPYYRNSVSKEMKVSFAYNRRLGDKISFFSSINYTRDNDKLTSFLLFNRDSSMMLGDSTMNPIGLYTDDFRGLDLSSSFSLDGTKYNVLMQGTWNFIKSINYPDIQLIPKFKFNTIITIEMTDYINLISNWYFISNREAIRMDSDPIVFELLNSSVNTNLSINYSFKSMIFSIDFRNILAQKLYFFDGYYDDDGRKLSLGFFYKF